MSPKIQLHKLKYQACTRLTIARTQFVPQKGFELHINIADHTFPIKVPLLKLNGKLTWITQPSRHKPKENPTNISTIIWYSITNLTQMQHNNIFVILTHEKY
jgi:hypothetical protein